MFRKLSNILIYLRSLLKRGRLVQRKDAHVTLGVAVARQAQNPFVRLPSAQRPQHVAILGLSGSGKTHLIEHMIRQDVQNDVGFVIFDVHGDLAESVIHYLAERSAAHPNIYARTVILEPFNPVRSFGFNPLEQSAHTSPFFQAQQFAYMLRKRWQEGILGARTEELLRNSLYTLSANGQTLLELPRLLIDRRARGRMRQNLPSKEIRMYWATRYDALTQRMQAVISEPILTRVSSFVADPQVRDIVGQVQSTFSFREAIERGWWVILNISKGKLGENSTILGSLLFTKLELEIMALANLPQEARRLYCVYADEVHNLTSESFEHLIAEARKYRIGLVSGHQFWNQLDVTLRHAMLGVGTKVFFRLHYHDAVELAGELAPAERNKYVNLLTSLDRGEAVVRIGHTRPTLISVPDHKKAQPTADELARLIAESDRRFTRTRSEIDRELQKRGAESVSQIKKFQSFTNSK